MYNKALLARDTNSFLLVTVLGLRRCILTGDDAAKNLYFEMYKATLMNENTDKKIHQGRNVKRFREMLGLKQEGLAMELGDDWNQKKISLLEAKEEIEPALLEQVAKVLKVPGEAIKNFDEQTAINVIGNTVHNHDNAAVINYYPTFNPIDRMVELYERMLQEKNEMIEKLEKIIAARTL